MKLRFIKGLIFGWFLLRPLMIFADTGTVVLNLTGTSPQPKPIHYSIFNSTETFLQTPILTGTVEGPNVLAGSIEIKNVPWGDIAISVFEDLDKNGEMARSPIGIPREPIGFSRGATGRFGPPAFSDAVIFHHSSKTVVSIELRKPSGQWTVGVGALFKSQPYKGLGPRVLPLPLISYQGNRFFFQGIRAGWLISRQKYMSMTGLVSYRFAGYDPEDSSELEGMEKRRDTVDGGAAIQISLPQKLKVNFSGLWDFLGRHNGGEFRVEMDRRFQVGKLAISPSLSGNWQTENLSDYYYGVRPREARPNRSADTIGDTFSYQADLRFLYKFGGRYILFTSFGAEYLDDKIRNSPIIDESTVLHGIFGINTEF